MAQIALLYECRSRNRLHVRIRNWFVCGKTRDRTQWRRDIFRSFSFRMSTMYRPVACNRSSSVATELGN